jgi:hypothetical protein
MVPVERFHALEEPCHPHKNPRRDPRTQDINVTPNIGITYSGSGKKLAEHAGSAMTLRTPFCCWPIPASHPRP